MITKRIKELLEIYNDASDDEKQAYLIQLRTYLPGDKTLRIDADGLLYYAAYSPAFKQGDDIGGSFVGESVRVRFKKYKEMFEAIVAEVVTECELASFRGELPRFKDYELIFTPSRNFRYDIFPEYKKSRLLKEQSVMLKRLKRWVKPLHTVADGVEADDLVYWYAMRGDPVASGDKDVVNAVPAAFYYHRNHRVVITNTKKEMDRWVLLQTLAGDPSDDIPGLKGVALKTAEKLLPEGATMGDVISIYESKGYTKEDAILTRRLVGLDQLDRRRRVKLYEI